MIAGTKRTTTRKKTTKPEKHTGLAGNGGPFSSAVIRTVPGGYLCVA